MAAGDVAAGAAWAGTGAARLRAARHRQDPAGRRARVDRRCVRSRGVVRRRRWHGHRAGVGRDRRGSFDRWLRQLVRARRPRPAQRGDRGAVRRRSRHRVPAGPRGGDLPRPRTQPALAQLAENLDIRGGRPSPVGPVGVWTSWSRWRAGTSRTWSSFPRRRCCARPAGCPHRSTRWSPHWVRDETTRRLAAAAQWLPPGVSGGRRTWTSRTTRSRSTFGRIYRAAPETEASDTCPYRGLAAFE